MAKRVDILPEITPNMSPMMRQYVEIKKQHLDSILFFRLGDFYEMFFDDAKLASKELELTLTGKNCGQEERAPMCGVPFHSAEGYIAKLVDKGYKVAICEQVEDPAASKGIVKREVIQIVTPGTLTAQSMLAEKENNYLAAIYLDEKEGGMSISYCDISTGEVKVTEYRDENLYETLLNELVKIKAKEIILNEEFASLYPVDEIKLITEAYNAVLLGSTGNLLQFKFFLENKNGDSTGENADCTITFTNAGVKKVLNQMYTSAQGREGVSIDLAEYIAEGTNNINIVIKGQDHLAATTVSVIMETYRIWMD